MREDGKTMGRDGSGRRVDKKALNIFLGKIVQVQHHAVRIVMFFKEGYWLYSLPRHYAAS